MILNIKLKETSFKVPKKKAQTPIASKYNWLAAVHEYFFKKENSSLEYQPIKFNIPQKLTRLVLSSNGNFRTIF